MYKYNTMQDTIELIQLILLSVRPTVTGIVLSFGIDIFKWMTS